MFSFGQDYNISSIMNSDFSLNITAYEAYSPACASPSLAVAPQTLTLRIQTRRAGTL